MTARTTQYAVGTIVTARPWVLGAEQEPRTGIVVGDMFGDGQYAMVWFTGMGELSRDDDGYAVQSIMTSKITVTGSLEDYAPSTLKRLSRRVYQGGHSRDVYVLNAIGAAYRTVTERAA